MISSRVSEIITYVDNLSVQVEELSKKLSPFLINVPVQGTNALVKDVSPPECLISSELGKTLAKLDSVNQSLESIMNRIDS